MVNVPDSTATVPPSLTKATPEASENDPLAIPLRNVPLLTNTGSAPAPVTSIESWSPTFHTPSLTTDPPVDASNHVLAKQQPAWAACVTVPDTAFVNTPPTVLEPDDTNDNDPSFTTDPPKRPDDQVLAPARMEGWVKVKSAAMVRPPLTTKLRTDWGEFRVTVTPAPTSMHTSSAGPGMRLMPWASCQLVARFQLPLPPTQLTAPEAQVCPRASGIRKKTAMAPMTPARTSRLPVIPLRRRRPRPRPDVVRITKSPLAQSRFPPEVQPPGLCAGDTRRAIGPMSTKTW